MAVERIDLSFESYKLPLDLTVDGEQKELHLQDLPFAVYNRYKTEASDPDKAMDALTDYAVAILNSNTEGIEFAREYVEAFGAVKLKTLCTLYTEWLNSVLYEKN
jgi:hypothetical protein